MMPAESNASTSIPLCVDLDGTLLRTDSLLESFLTLCHTHPIRAIKALGTLRGGVAAFKQYVAERVVTPMLPMHGPLLEHLKQQAALGRTLILATASDVHSAKRIVQPLELFAEVLGSDGIINLRGQTKAALLIERFGNRGFDYAGNSSTDLPVWAASRRAIVVSDSGNLLARVRSVTEIDVVFSAERDRAGLVKSLRPHQWAKNLLVFAPLFFAHRLTDLVLWREAAIAFLLFCACSSGIYLFNDLLDLDEDRRAPDRLHRPIAAGDTSILAGVAAGLVLIVGAPLASLALSQSMALLLLAYCALGIAYSFSWKRVPVIDTMTLTGFYLLRLFAGSFATGIPLSEWLLLFSLFFFFMLSMLKRYVDLSRKYAEKMKSPSRGSYVESDLPILSQLGISSGLASVLVFAFYIYTDTTQTLYPHNAVLWVPCILLFYWINHIWMLANRGRVPSDLTRFIASDGPSVLIAIATPLILLLASMP